MIEIKLYPYVLLGDSMRVLREIKPGIPIGEPVRPGESSLYDHLFETHDKLLKMGLGVTLRAYEDKLYDLMENFDDAIEYLDDGKSTLLTEEEAADILAGMEIITEILKYEAQKLQAYTITDKRLPVNKLLSNVGDLFGKGVFNSLPELAQYDFKQAGRSIAFGLPTAAAFHVLRGTEKVLRSYHASLIPSASNQSKKILWKQTIDALRKINNDTPPKELLDHLDNIRESFRNPTQHPESIYDLDEAQDLFNLCVDVINRMAKDLFERKIWEPTEVT